MHSVSDLLWSLFAHSGRLSYYALYSALREEPPPAPSGKKGGVNAPPFLGF